MGSLAQVIRRLQTQTLSDLLFAFNRNKVGKFGGPFGPGHPVL